MSQTVSESDAGAIEAGILERLTEDHDHRPGRSTSWSVTSA
jgi:hypothetical protein